MEVEPMTIRKHLLLSCSMLLLVAAPALAGPPLICHAFDTPSGASLISWGKGPGWNSPEPTYQLARLIGDVTVILKTDAPVLARMENLRRATIYAMRDPVVAEQLLKAVMTRALSTTTEAPAWFDAGYLIESYKQAEHMRERKGHAWAAVDETIKVDGYGFVKKAMAMAGPNAEMEFAASLMTQGAVAAAHRQRAAAAGPGSLVVKNLAKTAF
jgi:hypothetical protein